MYATYREAKRYARAMLDILQKLEVEISLEECQHALALGGGYRDWHDLHQSLASCKVRYATPQGFEHRVLLAVPRMALDPTARWIEAQIERQRMRRQGGAPGNHEFSDRHVLSYEYVRAIPLLHQSVTPELLPGSKPGVRLRQNIIWDLSSALNEVHFDAATMKLSFFGNLDTIFQRSIDHPNFQREFEALVAANIIEWHEDDELLILHPPPLQLVRDRIAHWRQLDADYYLASFEPPSRKAVTLRRT